MFIEFPGLFNDWVVLFDGLFVFDEQPDVEVNEEVLERKFELTESSARTRSIMFK